MAHVLLEGDPPRPRGAARGARPRHTTLELEGRTRRGWLVHEHIVAAGAEMVAAPRRFSHFHWIPVVGPGGSPLYLFRAMGDGSTRATRWTEDGATVTATVTSRFELRETEVAPEVISGRRAVPRAWSISAPAWAVELRLRAISGHTGHGDPRPSGRALYQQILVEGATPDGARSHGMVELILED